MLLGYVALVSGAVSFILREVKLREARDKLKNVLGTRG